MCTDTSASVSKQHDLIPVNRPWPRPEATKCQPWPEGCVLGFESLGFESLGFESLGLDLEVVALALNALALIAA